MAIIEPTIDHIDDQTVMLELRNLAGAVDKNEKALNDEMSSIQESQDNLEQMVGGFQDSIEQNTDDITTIKGNIQTIEEDLSTVEQKNTEQDTAIQQNASDIVSAKAELNQKITAEQNARESADTAEAIARANADIDLVDLTYASGGISIKLERPEGDLEDTVMAPFIKTATLIPTTTNRAFKIQFDLYDGTQYDTNEFVIPEGGGTDVSVTGVTIGAGTAPNSFKVSIELSDGTPIASNDYPFPSGSAYPTSATLSMTGTTISISIGMSAGQPLTGSVDIAPALANYATKSELSELTGQLMNAPQNVIGVVTTTQNGLMTFSDKVKLDGVAQNANNYVLPIGGTAIGGVKNGGNVTIESDGSMNVKNINTKFYVYHKPNSSYPITVTNSTITSGSGYKFTIEHVYSYYLNGITAIGNSSNEVNKLNIIEYGESSSSGSLSWTSLKNDWTNLNVCNIKVIDVVNKTIESIKDTGKYYKIHNMGITNENVASEINSPYIDVIVHSGQLKISNTLYSSSSQPTLGFTDYTYIEEFDEDPGF